MVIVNGLYRRFSDLQLNTLILHEPIVNEEKTYIDIDLEWQGLNAITGEFEVYASKGYLNHIYDMEL